MLEAETSGLVVDELSSFALIRSLKDKNCAAIAVIPGIDTPHQPHEATECAFIMIHEGAKGLPG